MDNECGNIVCDVLGGIGDSVGGAISYWSDPWGNTFKALQDAAESMSKDILPALTEATSPDLSSDFFLNAYAVSFAAAIFVSIALLIPLFVRTSRGLMAGRDLVESVGLYLGVFLVGAMFGPAVGILLVNFFHALGNVFIDFGIAGSIDTTVEQFQTMIADADPVGITGGMPIAVILMLCMIIGLFFVLLILLVRLVTLYFVGVMFPLGFVWIIDPKRREFGYKLAWLFVGLLAAEPLIWLLLGVAFSMMAFAENTFGNNASLQSLVTLLVAIIALFVATTSPLLLMKFAPILPMGSGGTAGPGMTGNPIGDKNLSETSSRAGASDRTSGSSSGGPAEVPAEAETAGGGMSELVAARAGSGAATGVATAAPAAATAAAPAAEVGAGMAAAGVAETATGAGAAIGIPTLLAAGAVAAASASYDVMEQAGTHAAEAMDEPTIGEERTQ